MFSTARKLNLSLCEQLLLPLIMQYLLINVLPVQTRNKIHHCAYIKSSQSIRHYAARKQKEEWCGVLGVKIQGETGKIFATE